MQSITGKLIDILSREIYSAKITISNGIIHSVERTMEDAENYILPGFIDAHVHIESSMLVPTSFAQLAVVHGTVATVSDPHEIANVCGIPGVQYMIDNSRHTPFKFFFGAPSCVPATSFETAGAVIGAEDVDTLLHNPDIWYLAEMMNYPGVLFKDPQVMAKLDAAQKAGKPIDGHAPGLRGNDVINYAGAGITTDHECFTLEEALDKLAAGMKILIREGSAARNYEALHPLLSSHPGKIMFCSDDKHPDELLLNHIDNLVKRSLQKGYNLFDILHAACVLPVQHYNLPVGLLREGDAADFIVIDNITANFRVLQTYISGELTAENGKSLLPFKEVKPINNFNTNARKPKDFAIPAIDDHTVMHVIEAIDGQLITNDLRMDAIIKNGYAMPDVSQDILKIAVVNRYTPNAPIATAFIKNFGLTHGALASTVAHDCHNIIAVGADDASICAAVNELIKHKGGIAVATDEHNVQSMPLSVAGLMSDANGHDVATAYTAIDAKAKELGTKLRSPFMTLSFMALLVIPSLKLSDKGLFNGKDFKFVPVIV